MSFTTFKKRSILLITILLFLVTFITCQNPKTKQENDFRGKLYRNISEINGFNNLSYIVGKNVGNDFVCIEYQDTVTFDRIILYTSEIRDADSLQHKIIDIFKINKLVQNQRIEFGSKEFGNDLEGLIVAIEEYKEPSEKSYNIFKAWTFNTEKERFEEIEVKGLYRINEGYYRNE